MESTQSEKEEHELNWAITEAMIKFGGNFVKNLGALYRLGDPSNQRKLRMAFPEYWKRYSELVDRVNAELDVLWSR